MIVSGAYGRDYKSADKAKAAWESGADFMCRTLKDNGRYCSIRDFRSDERIELRYNNDRSVVMVRGSAS